MTAVPPRGEAGPGLGPGSAAGTAGASGARGSPILAPTQRSSPPSALPCGGGSRSSLCAPALHRRAARSHIAPRPPPPPPGSPPTPARPADRPRATPSPAPPVRPALLPSLPLPPRPRGDWPALGDGSGGGAAPPGPRATCPVATAPTPRGRARRLDATQQARGPGGQAAGVRPWGLPPPSEGAPPRLGTAAGAGARCPASPERPLPAPAPGISAHARGVSPTTPLVLTLPFLQVHAR